MQKITVIEDSGFINLLITDFPVGDSFNMNACELLVRIPRSYPDAGPDMFWTTPELRLADGRVPHAADCIEAHLSRPWRRFSWHRRCWTNRDNLREYLEFVRRRLLQKQ